MRYLGIDYGDKHIGLALSIEDESMAFPLEPISNSAHLAEELSKLAKDKGAGAFVIGESRDFEGKDNPIMKKARVFAEELGKISALPVFFELEFMTSVEARHIQGGGDKTHSSAAALILKSFLDRKKNQ